MVMHPIPPPPRHANTNTTPANSTENAQQQPLFQGEPFAEFMESGSTMTTHADAIRIINTQTEIIVENLNEPKHTPRSRRQAIVYLLEQCMLLAAALPVLHSRERVRFRKIFLAVSRARRFARNDNM
jgi:hypothetical protein